MTWQKPMYDILSIHSCHHHCLNYQPQGWAILASLRSFVVFISAIMLYGRSRMLHIVRIQIFVNWIISPLTYLQLGCPNFAYGGKILQIWIKFADINERNQSFHWFLSKMSSNMAWNETSVIPFFFTVSLYYAVTNNTKLIISSRLDSAGGLQYLMNNLLSNSSCFMYLQHVLVAHVFVNI